MIFNYTPIPPFRVALLLPFACQSKHLIYWLGLWRRFLLPKCLPLSWPWPDTSLPALPSYHTFCQSASQAVYDESHLAFAWFALFIYSSILSDCLAVSLLPRSLSLSPHLALSAVLLQLYQSPFSLANQINSHSQSNRNPSKASAQSSMMPSLKSKSDHALLPPNPPYPAHPVVVHAA